MSKQSDIYDELVTQLETVLPDHHRLHNPYDLEENDENFLRQGWGIAISSGSNSNRTFCPKISIQRNYNIIITRQYYALQHDAVAKAVTEKQLLEDQLLLIENLCNNTELSGNTGHVIFETDGGIERIFGAKDQYMALQTIYRTEIFEET